PSLLVRYANPPFTGVAVTVATSGALLVFIAVNDAISPAPLVGRPMAGVSFVHVNALPVPLKLTAVVDCPLVTVWFETGLIVGAVFIVSVIGTPNPCCSQPTELMLTYPDAIPAGAEAVERT